MGIDVKLKVFEGPLDLLLHLIEKNKIDIYDIPIVEITAQYLQYVETLKEESLEVMSAFLVVGAQLVNIKSRMLLPVEEKEEEVLDPRTELVERLLEYKLMKHLSFLLMDKVQDAALSVFKKPSIPKEVMDYEEEPEISELLEDVTLAKLKSIFDFILKKQMEKKDTVRGDFGKIKKEAISLTDCVLRLKERAKTEEGFYLKDLLSAQKDRIHVIVHFLAVLELMKLGIMQAVWEEAEVKLLFVKDRELTEEEYQSLGD